MAQSYWSNVVWLDVFLATIEVDKIARYLWEYYHGNVM